MKVIEMLQAYSWKESYGIQILNTYENSLL